MKEPKNISLTKAMRNALVTGAPASLERRGLMVGDVHYRVHYSVSSIGITNSHQNASTAFPTTIEAMWKGFPIKKGGGYNYCHKWQDWRGSQGSLTHRES